MLLSQKLADFTKGQADKLRKAMGKKLKADLDALGEAAFTATGRADRAQCRRPGARRPPGRENWMR